MPPDRYSYQPLEQIPGSIRLLQILEARNDGKVRCKLVAGNIHNSHFRALSYVWGPLSETYDIELNEKLWKVRKSLYTFLRRAQYNYSNELIWVDALCINQNDITERNYQVSQMGKLYRSAFEVLVWLESSAKCHDFFSNFSEDGSWQGVKNKNQADATTDDPQDLRLQSWSGWYDPDNADETIPPIVDDMEDLEPWSDMDVESSRQLFTEIGDHPYWTRAWVVQEFCLAKSIVFVFSEMTLSFLQFERAFLLTDLDSNSTSDSNTRIGELIFWRRGNDQTVTDPSKLSYPDDLLGLLQRFGKRKCSDLRDRVFALVGMSNEVDIVQIDYKQDKWQVFISTLKSVGTNRFSAAMLLFEVLEISIDNIPIADVPVAAFTYPLASGFLVINGTGPRAKFERLWLCECRSCAKLRYHFTTGEQVLVKRTSQRSLWLLYTPSHTEHLQDDDTLLHLKFTACASPIGSRAGELCAFVPQTPLLALFRDSHITLRADRNSLPAIGLNQKSIFAHTFTAISQDDDHFEHKTMQPPSDDLLRQGQGSLGVLCTEWDWERGTQISEKI